MAASRTVEHAAVIAIIVIVISIMGMILTIPQHWEGDPDDDMPFTPATAGVPTPFVGDTGG